MQDIDQKASSSLFEQGFINEEQLNEIKSYRARNIFSLNAELKLFLYFSVTLFTTGIGLLIYDYIDTIGHSVLLGLVLILMFVCYYFSFKKAPKFEKTKTEFESPVMEYIVLTANLLTCIFIGYLQVQYTAFGTHYGLVTIIPTVIGLFSAFYFDNKNVLSLSITGLAAYIGLTVTPQSILQNEIYTTTALSFAALALGAVLLAWNFYCKKANFKTHFSFIYLTFAQHLIGISCLNNLIYQENYLLFIPVLAAVTYYFYHLSYTLKSISLFIFTLIYGFVGFNICFFTIIDKIDLDEFWEFLLVLSPLYTIGMLWLFVQMIKNFNTEIKK
ncbi:DUF2157 domain-containing protein [Flavobacterium faecale]|uniref:DUF2157 domain-containing protein n=1 Tax=Flavobacterium faecale TaxID=1355330 RepID=A0A2S1LE11_9FLAO|nr:DUF2157 domain-containing protein [Flavobacterium faecale]AWG21995.1 DUF2157 domain-containing protein [Flavobacterium faecale]